MSSDFAHTASFDGTTATDAICTGSIGSIMGGVFSNGAGSNTSDLFDCIGESRGMRSEYGLTQFFSTCL